MAERKSELDALAFDIQFFLSEHAQDLSPQQNRRMLRLLNELQRSFQDLVAHTAAQMNALQGHRQQVEQAALVKVRLNQPLGPICLLGCPVFGFSGQNTSTMIPGACVYQFWHFMSFRPFYSRQLFWLFFLPCFGFMYACMWENTCVCMCKYFLFYKTPLTVSHCLWLSNENHIPRPLFSLNLLMKAVKNI